MLAGVACGHPDATGLYEAGPDSMSRAFDGTGANGDGGTAAFVRARLAEQKGGGTPWNATAELRADGGFRLEMKLGSGQATERTGTWEWRGDQLSFTVTAADGQPTPQALAATLDDDALRVHAGPDTPDLVLFRHGSHR